MSGHPAIICVQIAAMGGQGGGVLSGWLAEAARRAGFPAQATSIPGVAQRTGATTYYFELFPQKNPPRAPVFSLFPDTGGLDLMVALEPAEAGRALQNRLISARTTVLSARQRLYSTAEKSAAAGHPASGSAILEPLSAVAGKTITLDVATLAKAAGGMGNAVFLGAICASGVLPIEAEHYRAAIEAGGNARANLAGFDAGMAALAPDEDGNRRQPGTPAEHAPPPPELVRDLAALPENLRPLAGHALARLLDYQSLAYARLYLERLEAVIAADQSKDKALSLMVARRLAAWMSFEDVIRVAQLKTRPGRFARIREEVGIGPGDPLRVTDYLKPGRDEIIAILPRFMARLLPGGNGPSGPGRPLRLTTSHVPGFAAMRFLASLKPLRPLSSGYHREQAAISRWLDALIRTASVAPDLALQLADAALCVRGYGRVRRRGMAALDALLSDWTNRLHHDRARLTGDITTLLHDARTNPDCLPAD